MSDERMEPTADTGQPAKDRIIHVDTSKLPPIAASATSPAADGTGQPELTPAPRYDHVYMEGMKLVDTGQRGEGETWHWTYRETPRGLRFFARAGEMGKSPAQLLEHLNKLSNAVATLREQLAAYEKAWQLPAQPITQGVVPSAGEVAANAVEEARIYRAERDKLAEQLRNAEDLCLAKYEENENLAEQKRLAVEALHWLRNHLQWDSTVWTTANDALAAIAALDGGD